GGEIADGAGHADVGGLPPDHAVATCGVRERADQLDAAVGGHRGLGQDREGLGEQRVADEDGGGLAEPDVDRGLAAALVVVVHGGEVVVDERVGVHELEGHGGGQGGVEVGGIGHRLEGGEHHGGAHALAPGGER